MKQSGKKQLTTSRNHTKVKKTLNPFEVHINKQKYDVLGKKSKNEKGLPGVSRSRAIRKRKATLLQEYKLKGKNNKFFDGRIGEQNFAMTAEDKILARFTAERVRFHSKKSLYNLGDNEILTHHGQNLADIEKFEDPKSDDDQDDDDGRNRSGKLDEDFVSDAHFGGGMLKKSDGDTKNRKDLIEQLIADSKKRKAEQQKLREQTLDMTEKLDTEWRDVFSLVSTASKKTGDKILDLKSDNKYVAYDKLSKELIFEARGKPTNKSKSEEEMAKEEREKLEMLEKERIKRMLGDTFETKVLKHRSADDLDDGFDHNDVDEFSAKKNKKRKIDDSQDSDNNSNEGSDVSEDQGNLGSGDEEEEEDKESEDDSDENKDESASDDDLSDLKESDTEVADESDKADNPTCIKKKNLSLGENVNKSEKNENSSLMKELKGLSFTLKVPSSYEGFEKMLNGHTPEYQATVCERMVKSNHPSLKDGSRDKLVTLLTYLLQHLQDTASEPSTAEASFVILNKLAPWLFDLTQFAPVTTTTAMCDVIKEKYDDFLKRPRIFPGLDTIIFFKVVGLLFPSSDYRHRLVTPTILFMEHILASCRMNSTDDLSNGLFVCTMLLEFTALSKRMVPEAINFVRGVLRLAQKPDCALPIVPPFRKKSSISLYVTPSEESEATIGLPAVVNLIKEDSSNGFKLRAVKLALQLLTTFVEYFEEPSAFLIFEPFLPLLIPDVYCTSLRDLVVSTRCKIQALQQKKLFRLLAEQKKPKPLKLYEPKIEEVYTLKKKKHLSKEKEDHEKLVHKYKKAVKGALREIRRDNVFLAKLKSNEIKSSDLERQRKVKEIFGDAAAQTGEIRKMKRAK